ncbi:MAG TPA: protoporphyrinogen oxidase HemJ [Pseudolabrys sp.]|nr:protoporphyrinogen oxidase HemJ [Pseudolabrys sp.]
MYLWIKALHIIAVIAWMAGMLYLPRLFVYHAGVAVGSPQSETFKVMEQRLLRFIMAPAMIAAWLFGFLLVIQGQYFAATWFHLKLLLVLVMSALHGFLSRWTRDFANDKNTHTPKFYRIANEIPTLLLTVIVILATVKPF